uniref:Nuclear receptor domain-containing protein n=1 Tax=Meloidogyne incognita TaxID=6306 RepID=A0A914N2B1_MELIC
MLSSSSLNLNILNQQSKKEGKCAVCGKDAFFYHYNVFSCNGCKQFFRRSIIENRKYICPRKSICEIKNGIKCRACRLSKCLNAGMNKLLVQQLALKKQIKKPKRRLFIFSK